ncbi:MAG: hypothetical protein LAC70_03650 [Methylovulum sp.]|jgi:ubiquinone biosynthesis protein UbiJ|nr:hypothetical protein [Methylovulum sp.]
MLSKHLRRRMLQATLDSLMLVTNKHQAFVPLYIGKVVALTMQPFGFTYYFKITPTTIILEELGDHVADAHVFGTLLALTTYEENIMSSSEHIKVSGDEVLAKHFLKTMQCGAGVKEVFNQHVHINSLSSLVEHGRQWSNESIETFKLNITEFLQEELRDSPSTQEVSGFKKKLLVINDDLKQLETKCHHIEVKLYLQANTLKENCDQT